MAQVETAGEETTTPEKFAPYAPFRVSCKTSTPSERPLYSARTAAESIAEPQVESLAKVAPM